MPFDGLLADLHVFGYFALREPVDLLQHESAPLIARQAAYNPTELSKLLIGNHLFERFVRERCCAQKCFVERIRRTHDQAGFRSARVIQRKVARNLEEKRPRRVPGALVPGLASTDIRLLDDILDIFRGYDTCYSVSKKSSQANENSCYFCFTLQLRSRTSSTWTFSRNYLLRFRREFPSTPLRRLVALYHSVGNVSGITQRASAPGAGVGAAFATTTAVAGSVVRTRAVSAIGGYRPLNQEFANLGVGWWRAVLRPNAERHCEYRQDDSEAHAVQYRQYDGPGRRRRSPNGRFVGPPASGKLTGG